MKASLKKQIHIEALRVYLLTCAHNYISLNVAHFSAMFGFEIYTTRAVVSQIMAQGELEASWDEQGNIVMGKHEQSQLHTLALNCVQRVSTMVDNNEKSLKVDRPAVVHLNVHVACWQSYENQIGSIKQLILWL